VTAQPAFRPYAQARRRFVRAHYSVSRWRVLRVTSALGLGDLQGARVGVTIASRSRNVATPQRVVPAGVTRIRLPEVALCSVGGSR
jgi:hypothetical protein